MLRYLGVFGNRCLIAATVALGLVIAVVTASAPNGAAKCLTVPCTERRTCSGLGERDLIWSLNRCQRDDLPLD